jgi:CubicO group peptidase (beta-lactamase class C family)
MNKFRVLVSLSIVLISLVVTTYMNSAAGSVPDLSAIDSLAGSILRSYNLPGLALVIVEGDRISYTQGYGQADSTGRQMTAQTPVTIGSVSKSFTALAILQLVEKGKIKLDDRVITALPWFHTDEKAISDQITIRQLLNHTSGLSNAIGLEPVYDRQPGYTLQQRLAGLKNYHMTRPAGAQFEYSNMNYLLLGAVIETVSGLDFSEYLEQYIFSPLDMQNSTARLHDAQQNGMADGFSWWFGLPLSSAVSWYQDAVPAGYILSTAEDMGHYLLAQLNGGRYGENALLSPEGITEMQHGVIQAGADEYYGMGWVEGQVGELNAVYHEGDAAGFTSTVMFDPAQGSGVAVLCNISSMLVSPTHTLASQIFQALHAQPISKPGLTTITLYLRVDLLVIALTVWMVLAYIFLSRWWKALGEWRKKGAGTRLVKIFLPIVTDLFWPYMLLGFIPQGAGFPMWRVLNVFQPDLAYWLQTIAWAAVMKGMVKMILFFIFIRVHKPPSIARLLRSA